MYSKQLQFNFNEYDTSWVWEIFKKHDEEIKHRKKRKKFLRPF